MDDMSTVYEWAKTNSFDDEQIYYTTILALNILDGSSQMDYDNNNLFMAVYDGISDQYNTPFNKKVHKIIALSRGDDPLNPKDEYKEAIHNLNIAMVKNIENSTMDTFKELVWNQLQ